MTEFKECNGGRLKVERIAPDTVEISIWKRAKDEYPSDLVELTVPQARAVAYFLLAEVEDQRDEPPNTGL